MADTFTVPCEVGGRIRDMVARPVWQRGGLAVHRDPVKPERWNVTHVASGYALRHFYLTKREAIVAAQAVLPLTDWTVDRPALLARPGLSQATRAALRGLNGHDGMFS